MAGLNSQKKQLSAFIFISYIYLLLNEILHGWMVL